MRLEERFIDFLTPFLGKWVYLGIFLFSFLESNPVSGFLIPGMTLVIVAGFLARAGLLNLWIVALSASIGAFFGDLFGYWLGRKHGSRVSKFLSSYSEKKLNACKGLLKVHLGKILLLGRFNSLARAFVPFSAGISRVDVKRVIFYAFFGGFLWGVFFAFLGYLFGESYRIVSSYIGRFFFFAIITAVFLAYTYRLINYKKRRLSKENFYLIISNLSSLMLFAILMDRVARRENWILALDKAVYDSIFLIKNPFLSVIMKFMSALINYYLIGALILVLAVFFVRRKERLNSILLIIGIPGSFFLERIFKFLIGRSRPFLGLLYEKGFSFPSGHATIATSVFFFLIYAFKDRIKNPDLRSMFISANVLMIVLISFSRVYLGVHWMSDVIAGILLGFFWMSFLVLKLRTLRFLIKKRNSSKRDVNS